MVELGQGLGLLAPGNFDAKGFADSGRQIAPSEFAARLASIQEEALAEIFLNLNEKIFNRAFAGDW